MIFKHQKTKSFTNRTQFNYIPWLNILEIQKNKNFKIKKKKNPKILLVWKSTKPKK